MAYALKIRRTLLEVRPSLGNCLVVHRWTKLREDVVEEKPSLEIAKLFIQVLGDVSAKRRNRLRSRVIRDADRWLAAHAQRDEGG